MRDINKMREHIEEATWGRRERRPFAACQQA